MSNKRKGDRREREARGLYEQAGYEVQPFRGTRYEEKDGFGLFDFMAVGKGDPRMVQVKSNGAQGVNAFFKNCTGRFGGANIVPEYLIAYDNQGWRLLGLGGHQEVYTAFVDERGDNGQMGEQLVDYLTEQNVRDDDE